MAYDEALAERIRAMLSKDGVKEKKMFGGVCFLLGGNMVCGITREDLMVRVGAVAYEDALARPHARPMEFTGRPMKGMVFVGAGGYGSDTGLREWVERGMAFARTLPVKGEKVAKKKVPKTSER